MDSRKECGNWRAIAKRQAVEPEPPVGHEVTLTGRPTEGAIPGFKASKITHVSDTCKPAAVEPK